MYRDSVGSPVNIDGPEIGILGVVKCTVVHKLATHGGVLANFPCNLRTRIRRRSLRAGAFGLGTHPIGVGRGYEPLAPCGLVTELNKLPLVRKLKGVIFHAAVGPMVPGDGLACISATCKFAGRVKVDLNTVRSSVGRHSCDINIRMLQRLLEQVIGVDRRQEGGFQGDLALHVESEDSVGGRVGCRRLIGHGRTRSSPHPVVNSTIYCYETLPSCDLTAAHIYVLARTVFTWGFVVVKTAYAQNVGQCPAREPAEDPSNQVLRYGDLTARGQAGGLAGLNSIACDRPPKKAAAVAANCAARILVLRCPEGGGRYGPSEIISRNTLGCDSWSLASWSLFGCLWRQCIEEKHRTFGGI